MGHEDAVYLAKLAEQAERYEGMYYCSFFAIESVAWSNAMVSLQKWLRT